MLTVPVRSFTSAGAPAVTEAEVPCIDIHELLAYLHNEVGVVAPEQKVEEYWAHLRSVGMPFAVGHPGTNSHVPFSIYGDETVIGQDPHDKVLGIFISLTLFRPKSVRHGQFLVFAIHADRILNENLATLTPVLRHLVWSANIAFDGVFPHVTMDGLPLPAKKQARAGAPIGRCFACCEIKGDWKWHEKWLRLERTPVSIRPCYMCDAEGKDNRMKYYDFSENAPWIETELDTPGFIARVLRPGAGSARTRIRAFCDEF